MRPLKKILLGVDLTRSYHLSADGLPPDNREAVRRAIWLARDNRAMLLICSALNLSERALRHVVEEERGRLTQTVEQAARAALGGLVAQAKGEGVEARPVLARGKAWSELVGLAFREHCDLVVVGTGHSSALSRLL